jgi:hypothetical protein
LTENYLLKFGISNWNWLFSPEMGRLFLEHLGGCTSFHCDRCKTYLTHKMECLSDGFQGIHKSIFLTSIMVYLGATGPAYLFDRVVNISFSEVEVRCMITGKHIVRDVHCKNCRCKLGWMVSICYFYFLLWFIPNTLCKIENPHIFSMSLPMKSPKRTKRAM